MQGNKYYKVEGDKLILGKTSISKKDITSINIKKPIWAYIGGVIFALMTVLSLFIIVLGSYQVMSFSSKYENKSLLAEKLLSSDSSILEVAGSRIEEKIKSKDKKNRDILYAFSVMFFIFSPIFLYFLFVKIIIIKTKGKSYSLISISKDKNAAYNNLK